MEQAHGDLKIPMRACKDSVRDARSFMTYDSDTVDMDATHAAF